MTWISKRSNQLYSKGDFIEDLSDRSPQHELSGRWHHKSQTNPCCLAGCGKTRSFTGRNP